MALALQLTVPGPAGQLNDAPQPGESDALDGMVDRNSSR